MSTFYPTKMCNSCKNMGIRYNYFEKKYEKKCCICGYEDPQEVLV